MKNNKNENMFITRDCIIGDSQESEHLGSIFGEDIIYEIPSYQRPYNWTEEQLEELWEDIRENFKQEEDYRNKNNLFYLGTIITNYKMNEKKVVEVIDGQQRLTTLMILFFVITKITAKEDLKKYIYNEKQKKLRFDTSKTDSTDFGNIIEQEGWYKYVEEVENIEKILDKKTKKDKHKNETEKLEKLNIKIYTNNGKLQLKGDTKELKKCDNAKVNFYNTAFYFYYKIKEEYNEISEIEKFKNYILNKIHFNRIICKTEADGLEMFQVVNDRGLDLTSADLIKTYLLKMAQSEKKEQSFDLDYKEIKDNIKSADITMDEFFTIFIYYKNTTNTRKGSHKEFKDILKNEKNYNIFMNEIKEISVRVKEIADGTDWRIHCLRYLPWKQYIWAIMVCGKDYEEKWVEEKENKPDIKEINEAIIRFYYLFLLNGAGLNTIKTQSFVLMKNLKECSGNIKEMLEENLKDKYIIEEIENKLYFSDKKINEKLNAIGDESYVKSILMLIEYMGKRDETDTPKNKYIDISKDNIQLEHILPQNFDKNTENEWDFWKEDKSLINALGNLTLLLGPKNLAASNKGFSKKIEDYEKNNSSEFYITKEICDKYKNNELKRWDKKAINNRTAEFKKILSEKLNINFY